MKDFMKESLKDTNGKFSAKRIIALRSFQVLALISLVEAGVTLYFNQSVPLHVYIIHAAIVSSGLGLSIVEQINSWLRAKEIVAKEITKRENNNDDSK